MYLNCQHTFQFSTAFIQVNDVNGFGSIDPVLVMVAFHKHTVFVPLIGSAIFGSSMSDLVQEYTVMPSA